MAHQHWRILATRSSEWEAYYRSVELYERNSSTPLSGGRAYAKDFGMARDPASAFDDSVDSMFRLDYQPGQNQDWIAYEHVSPVYVSRVVLLQYGQDCNHVFDFELQCSNDGAEWATAMRASNVPAAYDSNINDAEWLIQPTAPAVEAPTPTFDESVDNGPTEPDNINFSEDDAFAQVSDSTDPSLGVDNGYETAANQQQYLAVQRDQLYKLDANMIYRAAKGFGTDDKALIDAICFRNKAQLRSIDLIYAEKYGKRLRDVIKDECSGDFKDFLKACVTPVVLNKVGQLKKAMDGVGTNSQVVTNILVTATAEELVEIKKVWDEREKTPLVDRLKDELSGTVEKLLVKILLNPRPESTDVDNAAAEAQAQKLHKAAKGFGTDEKPFIEILTSQSRAQIQAIKQQYERLHSKSLKSIIKDEFSGDSEYVLLTLLDPSPAHTFAHALKDAMSGINVDEDTVIRLLAAQEKSTCRQIAKAYLSIFNDRLEDALSKKLDGNLKKAALRWATKVEPEVLENGEPAEGDAIAQSLSAAIAERDAFEIYAATKGLGTNESRIIDVVCSRSKPHLFTVDMIYRENYKKTLIELFQSECSGDFLKLLKYLVMPEALFDLYQTVKATKGLGTNEALLIEVLASRTGDRVLKLKAKMEARETPLIDLINSEVSGDLRKVFVMLLEGRSDAPADEALAAEQADQLHEAGAGTWGTNEKKFIEIISGSSTAQCNAIRAAYESKYQHSLEHAIISEFSGDMQSALLALLLSPVDYHCVRLKRALHALNVSESVVARMLGGNDKAFVREVANRYFERYDERLVDVLKKKLSGEFGRACVAWVTRPSFAADSQ